MVKTKRGASAVSGTVLIFKKSWDYLVYVASRVTCSNRYKHKAGQTTASIYDLSILSTRNLYPFFPLETSLATNIPFMYIDQKTPIAYQSDL